MSETNEGAVRQSVRRLAPWVIGAVFALLVGVGSFAQSRQAVVEAPSGEGAVRVAHRLYQTILTLPWDDSRLLETSGMVVPPPGLVEVPSGYSPQWRIRRLGHRGHMKRVEIQVAWGHGPNRQTVRLIDLLTK